MSLGKHPSLPPDPPARLEKETGGGGGGGGGSLQVGECDLYVPPSHANEVKAG